MESFDPTDLLEAIDDERVLPHPVKLRDVMSRTALTPDQSLELQKHFQEYLKHFGAAEATAREMLERLARAGG